jgi:hypothetical protein
MRIVLAGIVKNIEPYFLTIKKFIEDLNFLIPNLEVCIYENNSSDKTKDLLETFQKDFIKIKCENYSEEFFIQNFPARTFKNESCRISNISFARNKLLEMIQEKNLDENDYIIMMDLDCNSTPDVNIINEVITCWPEGLHVLFANGIDCNGHYYDGYEFRSNEFPYGPEILGDIFWSNEYMAEKHSKKYEDNSTLTPVISAFGGLAIYKAYVIKGCRYSADITPALHEFYTSLDIIEANPETHYNGCSLGLYKDSIFYKNNSGYNYPVCAEHVNFHLEIRKNGYKNMFICPFLYYYWG